jgi:hypothetical protein
MLRYLSTNGGDFSDATLNLMAVAETVVGECIPECSAFRDGPQSGQNGIPTETVTAIKLGIDPFALRYRRVNGSSPEPLKSLPFMLRYLSTNGRDFSGTNLNLIEMFPKSYKYISHNCYS